jgi:N-acetylneuraminic acid mutarotase
VVYKDKAYVLALSDRFLYEFDPASKVWRAVSRYPGDIDDSNVLAVFDDKLFKFSGSSSTYEEGDLWVYDFGSETWETKEKMPFRFYKGSQFRIGEQIFMVTDLGQVWSYAPGSGIFSRKNDFPDEVERVNFAFKENGDQFLVNWSNIWRYNSEQDEWNATLSPYATGFSGTTGEYYPGFIQNGALHQLRDFQDIYRFDRTHNRSFRIARYPHCYKDENRIRTAFTINDKTYIFYAYDDYRESCMLAMYAFKYGD